MSVQIAYTVVMPAPIYYAYSQLRRKIVAFKKFMVEDFEYEIGIIFDQSITVLMWLFVCGLVIAGFLSLIVIYEVVHAYLG